MVEPLDWYLYSIIESLKKIREIAGFIPNQLRFHKKNFWEAEFVKTGAGKNRGFPEHCVMAMGFVDHFMRHSL